MRSISTVRSAIPMWAWACAAGVVVLGAAWAVGTGVGDAGRVVVLLATASAILVAPRRPAAGLVLLTSGVLLQAALGVDLNPAQVFAGAVFFSAGRYGTARQHVWAGAAVIVLGVLEVLGAVRSGSEVVQAVLEAARLPVLGLILLASVGVAVLTVPLLLGIALQAGAAAREDGQARLQAEEQLAETRLAAAIERERARMARDVHDTVGHALTVVITQSRMLAAVADRDPAAAARAALAVESVAGSALEEVRGVLAGVVEPADVTIEDLVELAGSTDRTRVVLDGAAPLLPGLVGETAYRAAQELITNALRHGHAEEPVEVRISTNEQRITIEVRNALAASELEQRVGGSGLHGLRDRLSSVGGALEVGRMHQLWVARAEIPIGAQR